MTKFEYKSDVKIWKEEDVVHIDVRGLVPPQPMVAVLSLLESEKVLDRIVVHIDREPIYLYPELEEYGWSYETSTIDADYYQVAISKLPNGKQTD
jgi:Uncharacterized conserved protein (DUF2249)